MASTYTRIASYTVPSSTASYTFTSIPSIYTDLVVIGSVTTSSSSGLNMQFNGDTGTNYKFMYMFGNGSTVSSGNIETATNLDVFYTNTTISTGVAHIMNYANTSTRKVYVSRFNPSTEYAGSYCGEWASTAAITSIKFETSGTISAGSTLTLYGIAAA